MLSNLDAGAAKGSSSRCGEALIVPRQEGSEDHAGKENGSSEDEDVRSEGKEEYWRSHYRGLLWCGLVLFWLNRTLV